MTRPKQTARPRARFAAIAATLLTAALTLTACTGETERPVVEMKPISGEITAETVAEMEAAVNAAIPAAGASGAIVGVWVPWAGSWVTGLGTTKTGGSTPVTTDMTFRAGNITREMTCDVLYGLAHDGVVKLDDLMSKYVQGVGEDSEITLGQLCDGTSGLVAIAGSVHSQFITNPDRVWQPRELASFGFGRTTTAKPGAGFIDADTNYFLLGMALTNASDMTAQELIEKYVTAPLQLTGTELPTDAPAVPNPAPYLPGQLVQKNAEDVYDCAAPLDVSKLSASTGYLNSGVTTTIDDLGIYSRALASGSLDVKDQKQRFADPLPVSDKAATWYMTTGGSYVAGGMVGQYGEVPGYSVAAFSDPKTGLTVAVVLNSSSAAPEISRDLAFQLAAIASKTPATGGNTAPAEFGLPWTAQAYAESIVKSPICAPPAAE